MARCRAMITSAGPYSGSMVALLALGRKGRYLMFWSLVSDFRSGSVVAQPDIYGDLYPRNRCSLGRL
jgi:hypothetical protein